MTLRKIHYIGLLLMTALIFFVFGGSDIFTLTNLEAEYGKIQGYYIKHPLITLIVYAVIYIIVTGLSLPGATVLTLVGGALFGLFWGTVVVSFASSIGATLAFLAARHLLRDAVEKKFGGQLRQINEGIAKEGAYYLFALRLVPLIPFFGINLLMGLTTIPTVTYYWVSQVGMFAGTVIYVNAGTQLAGIKSLSGIASPAVLASLALLGIFPLVAKKVIEHMSESKAKH